ncbi:MAG TPA: amidohydrolase family protein [Thermomicrobiales bacterium]|jgi:N-acetylglucosamine-6-phosphate deacetylase|nr:amidohydrolase family protein [Thermomicrobiales bacterium]
MAVDSHVTSMIGRRVDGGHPVEVRLDGARIASVSPVDVLDGDADALPWLAPGLVDLQVNGFAGIDFNGDALSVDRLGDLVRAVMAVGTTTFLPTVTTADPGAIEDRLRAIAAAVTESPHVAGAVAGIHLEGPFISPEDGPRGAHPAGQVRPPDWGLFQRWQLAAGGLIRIVTLSPEWPEAATFIARCRATGVIPAIGHTAATPEQIREAVAAGAKLTTHFGNGAHPVLARHPNYLWEQLAADELWASMIADGAHLPESVLKVVLRVKGDRAILVSDTVDLAGMAPGMYPRTIGGQVVLTGEGRLHLASDPRLLAGSVRPLLDGVTHLVRAGLAPLGRAWAMASTGPATVAGLPSRAGLTAGAPADLVLFRERGGRLDLEQVVKSGQVVLSARLVA